MISEFYYHVQLGLRQRDPDQRPLMIYALPLLAPAILILAAVLIHCRPATVPVRAAFRSERAALLALGIAAASMALLIRKGSGDNGLFGLGGVGLSVRVDAVSATMLLLVAFIGWIVVRYAHTYLDGEARHAHFTIWLLGTLAAVLLLAQLGNLVQFIAAWIAASLCLDKLLLFYPCRIKAQRGAQKIHHGAH